MLNREELQQHRGEVLAWWVSGRKEWMDFCRWKQQHRKLTGLMGILCRIMRFTGLAGFMEVLLIRTYDVIITNTGVSINGRFNTFAGESATLQRVDIIEEASPKILQICYQCNTEKGITAGEMYVPIPKGKLGEAVKVMSLLENGL